ncbi:hypothetical protein KW842_01925 [Duganella sp. sic0402]|uniref:hypothetical protein n=1 Tax=Duganella sp. sic0402 TaxID=2854786 RepID=UPI001C48651A|nr:hypothetical protein [Duganella sp. sic0402]MBV7534515.1 hypothetical protein [Duganella sp. sic0402]
MKGFDGIEAGEAARKALETVKSLSAGDLKTAARSGVDDRVRRGPRGRFFQLLAAAGGASSFEFTVQAR